MDNLSDLKTIWQSADTTPLPDAAKMVQTIKSFRSKVLRKKWLTIVMGTLCTILILLVTFFAQPRLVSTYIGGVLIAASGLYYVVNNLVSLKRFYRPFNFSNREYLAFIEQTRRNQVRHYATTQVLLMLLNTAGLLLYLYEPAKKSLTGTLLLFIAAAGFMLYHWLVVRPRVFNKSQQQLETLRSKIENITLQLNENEKQEY